MSAGRTFVDVSWSSRRRHTRSKRDWSSDVCSSDLSASRTSVGQPARDHRSHRPDRGGGGKIGRASCRERVYISVVGGSLKKKTQTKASRKPGDKTRQLGQGERADGLDGY